MLNIKTQQQITHKELRNTPIPTTLQEKANLSQVPFFIDPANYNSGGSGTLVTYGSLKGILTATHVLKSFQDKRKEKYIYVSCIPMQNFDAMGHKKISFISIITPDDLNAFDNYKSAWSDRKLDVALILLDEETFTNLINISGKVPYDLQASHYQYNNNKSLYSSNNTGEWLCAIYGHPRENVTQENNIYNFNNSGLYIGGPMFVRGKNTLKIPVRKYNDIYPDEIEILQGITMDDMPLDFGGTSGGGLWLAAINQHYQIVEFFLSGIFVYQDKKKAKLGSRGTYSLYDIFCDYLDKYIND